jgi:hypothetical protein
MPMRRFARLSFVAALGCLVAAPSRADEILFFANGTTMPIKSHLIKDGMIHVDLGAKASMAFPASAVDRIEMSGRPVYTTGGKTANQAVPGAPFGGSTEQDGRAGGSQYRGAGAVPPQTGSNDGTPAPAAASPVGGRFSSAMNPSNQTAPQGMQRIGNRIGFAPPKLGQPAAGAITGFGKRGTTPPPVAGDGSQPPTDTPPVVAPPDGLPEVGHPEDGEGDDDDEDSPE